MARSVYVAGVEGFTGKSAVALGVLEQLSRRVERVAVFRPVVRAERPTGDVHDYVLDLLVSHDAVALSYDECAGVTYDDVHADPDGAMDRIVARYHQVAEQCDAVVVVGSDYTDVGAPAEFAFNARVAANLGAPVLLVLNGHGRDVDQLRTAADLAHGRARRQPRQPVRGHRQPRGPRGHRPDGDGAARATAYRRTPSPSSRCSVPPPSPT